jgi:NADPH-dependent 2,4-dienoyl-CoA reductase/sulfur reductase-like enzyme
MAQRVIFVDDLDGTEGAETIKYGLDGVDYEIDLSEKNADRLRGLLEEFIEKSRRIEQEQLRFPSGEPRRRRRRTDPPSGRTHEELQNIRAWAQANNYDVAPRGRIKREIIEEYDRAQASGA